MIENLRCLGLRKWRCEGCLHCLVAYADISAIERIFDPPLACLRFITASGERVVVDLVKDEGRLADMLEKREIRFDREQR